MTAATRTRRNTLRTYAPQAFERGSWITWTDADGTTRHAQITDQTPAVGTWWLTSLTGDDQLETYLLRRLPIRTNGERRRRDERIARGEHPYLYEVHAIAYTRNERGDIHGIPGDNLAPATACEEPQAEALARNGQTALPIDVTDEETQHLTVDTEPATEGARPVAVRQTRRARRAAARSRRATLKARTRTQRAATRINRHGVGTLATHCIAAGLGVKEARTVAGSLRKNAAKAGVTGQAGTSYAKNVKARTCTRYTPAEVARIAVIYRPRKDAYRIAARRLSLAA